MAAGFGMMLYAGLATAAPVAGPTAQAAPANGTANFLNITFQAQMYVGFYGNVSSIVMKNGGDVGTSLLNHTMMNGTVFLTKAANTFSGWAPIVAPTDDMTDANMSLLGEYKTKYWFVKNGTEGCGVGFNTNWGLPQVNTTDNFTVTLIRNASTGVPAYMFCTHINQTISANGFSFINYELIAPKTSTWTSYDFYVEGGYT